MKRIILDMLTAKSELVKTETLKERDQVCLVTNIAAGVGALGGIGLGLYIILKKC